MAPINIRLTLTRSTFPADKIYPFVGCVLSAIALGLYTRMTPASPSYVIIGNLILGGFAGGVSIIVPMLVSQASVPAADLSMATSTQQFFQNIAVLLCIAVMQSVFNSAEAALVLPALSELTDPSVPPAQASADVSAA